MIRLRSSSTLLFLRSYGTTRLTPDSWASSKQGEFWATEARHTRDRTEFVHARDLCLEYLNELNTQGNSDIAYLRESLLGVVRAEFSEGSLSEGKTEVFIASFSSIGDLKSQWDRYADHEKGVSIAFDLRQVRPPKQLTVAATLAPCIYEKADAKRLLQAALGHYLVIATEMSRRSNDLKWMAQRFSDWTLVDRIYGTEYDVERFMQNLKLEWEARIRTGFALTRFDLLRLASHCKNPFYREEHEWRLALAHTKGKPLINIRIEQRGSQSEIPYVAHDLFTLGRPPITEVMMGLNAPRGTCRPHFERARLLRASDHVRQPRTAS